MIETDININGVSGYGGVSLWVIDNIDNNGVIAGLYAGTVSIRQAVNGVQSSATTLYNFQYGTWYQLKVVADSVSGIVDVFINGDYILSYPVTLPNRTGISGVYFGNAGGFIDNFDLSVPLVSNQPPTVSAGGPYNVSEGDEVIVAASGSDPESEPLSFAWDIDSDGTVETPGQRATFSAATLDGPSSHTVTVQVTDNGGLTATDQATINLLNVAPTVGAITGPVDPVQVNTPINTSANFTDPGVLDTHTAVWDWGDGNTSAGTVSETNGSGSVTGSYTYTSAGIYTVKVTVTDDDGGSGESIFQYIVVYDPDGGFVTGGGWFNSPAGAYASDPSLTGKANFGFVSKYQKGANVPTGQTEFQFKVANLNFHSTSYQWLVVAGAKAQYKGAGTIKGSGDYGFMLTAIDGQVNGGGGVDKFRIKIWDKATGDVIYDNQMGAGDTDDPATAIAGGSIVIHK